MNPSYKEDRKGIHFVFLTGNDHFELGFMHGKLLSREIQTIVNSVEQYLEEKYGNIPQELLFDYLLYKAIKFESKFPRQYLEEMKGIAEGSGVPYRMILAANVVYEIAFGLDKYLHLSNGLHGCSAFIAPQPQSRKVFFAKVTDFGLPSSITDDFSRQRMVFIYHLPWKKTKFATFGFPSTICSDNVIKKNGLTFAFNDGGSFEKNINYEHFPILFLARMCADNVNSLSELEKKLRTIPTMKPYSVIVSDGSRKGSAIYDIAEGDFEKIELNNYLINTNHFHSQRMIKKYYKEKYDYKERVFYLNTVARTFAIKERIDQVKNAGNMIEIVKYHTENFDQDTGSISNSTTVQGFVYDAKTQTIYAPDGEQVPATFFGRWQKFSLTELFDQI